MREGLSSRTDENYVNLLLQEAPGCAILDCGATIGVTSLTAADEIQSQRLKRSEPGIPEVLDSSKRFRFGDGGSTVVGKYMRQPVIAGILNGQTLDFHIIDKAENDTLPLFPISEMRRQRMVIDLEDNSISFKDKPDLWHKLPTADRGVLLLPITREAVQRFGTDDITTVQHEETGNAVSYGVSKSSSPDNVSTTTRRHEANGNAVRYGVSKTSFSDATTQ